MIDQKSVIIGFIISIILVFLLGNEKVLPGIGLLFAVFIGSIVTGYWANKKTQLKVVESALHGILVGIFTGIAQILITYFLSGYSAIVAGILIYFALVLIGAYIIIGALGGVVGTLIHVKYGKSNRRSDMGMEDQPEN